MTPAACTRLSCGLWLVSDHDAARKIAAVRGEPAVTYEQMERHPDQVKALVQALERVRSLLNGSRVIDGPADDAQVAREIQAQIEAMRLRPGPANSDRPASRRRAG